MSDINKVWLSGLVISSPVLTKLASRTPFTYFTMQVNERFVDRNGIAQFRPNLIRVESLGKSAEINVNKVKQGSRYTVDGYLRHDTIDGHESIRVRTFAVYLDDSVDSSNYREGLKRALEVLRKSRDLESAVEKIEEMITGGNNGPEKSLRVLPGVTAP
jgi:single-stranded DNA-binding protein